MQSLQSMQSFPPDPVKTPEKISVPADDFISHPSPAQPASPPVDADPVAARIAELEGLGWSPWNAKAKAEGEAREARKADSRDRGEI